MAKEQLSKLLESPPKRQITYESVQDEAVISVDCKSLS